MTKSSTELHTQFQCDCPFCGRVSPEIGSFVPRLANHGSVLNLNFVCVLFLLNYNTTKTLNCNLGLLGFKNGKIAFQFLYSLVKQRNLVTALGHLYSVHYIQQTQFNNTKLLCSHVFHKIRLTAITTWSPYSLLM